MPNFYLTMSHLHSAALILFFYPLFLYKGYDLIDICFNISGIFSQHSFHRYAFCANLERVKETSSSVYPSPTFLFGIDLVNCFDEMTFSVNIALLLIYG